MFDKSRGCKIINGSVSKRTKGGVRIDRVYDNVNGDGNNTDDDDSYDDDDNYDDDGDDDGGGDDDDDDDEDDEDDDKDDDEDDYDGDGDDEGVGGIKRIYSYYSVHGIDDYGDGVYHEKFVSYVVKTVLFLVVTMVAC
ncbi:hypothetical protein ElyMa_001529500 [Elysia marginata]|uniref:Uncharacterized protein n=1 Tax=Elysia marginata TaxID=1093978 RepID=A0AAV4J7U4_9GAST|nr:hypothetical protein ElyMa_001529500 [Elysia marginata]